MKLVKNVDFNLLEEYGFMYEGTYYYVYNPLSESTPKQLKIDKYTREILYINGKFEKGQKILIKLEEAGLIEK